VVLPYRVGLTDMSLRVLFFFVFGWGRGVCHYGGGMVFKF